MPERKRILFVDDEVKVLQGLRRQLHSLRSEWDMVFVESAQKALSVMEKEPFDVVISDMRMPCMDGAELLSEIARRSPETVRIILSGYTDYEYILKAIGPAHQYLTKPCDPEDLRSAVVRACRLRELLKSERLVKLLARLDHIPSAPSLFQKLMAELRSTRSTAESVGRIIEKDPAMTAKVLQLVNSAFFGLRSPVASAARATSLLGVETVRSLALSVQAFSEFSAARHAQLPLQSLWDHAMTTAVFAHTIGTIESESQHIQDECFTAGLLHDIGIFVLAANMPEEYRTIFAQAFSGAPLKEREYAAFGASHSEAGAYLLGLWGLPDTIVEAVAYHHTPHLWAGHTFAPLVAIHAADAFAWELTRAEAAQLPPIPMQEELFTKLKLYDRLTAWKEACNEVFTTRINAHEREEQQSDSPGR